VGVLSGTGLAPRAAGMSTLSSNATGSAPSEVDLETRGARAGGREDVLHGGLENAFVLQWLVRNRCWRVRKEG
jgi:hypothetical protein